MELNEQTVMSDKIYTREEIIKQLDGSGEITEYLNRAIDETLRAERAKLMDFFGLTVKDLPAFPPKDIDMTRLILTIGMAKN